MNVKARACQFQRRRAQEQTKQMDTNEFFNLLTSPELFDVLERHLPEHRERRYPPTETLSMFLSQAMSADRSCQNVVNTSEVKRAVAGLPRQNTYTGSYCKARQRLPAELIKALARHTGQALGKITPREWLWQGRPVKLIDGTTVTMPDTETNQAVYPQQRNQQPGLGFPICRVLGVVCLASGCIVDAAMGPYRGKGGSEHGLLRQVVDSFLAGDIVIGDAIYCSYFMLADLKQRGVDAVFEQNGSRRKSTDFRRGKRLGENDHLVIYHKPKLKPDWMSEDAYDQVPDTIEIRELKVGEKILVTTLLSEEQATKSALKWLYKNRWHVELDLRNIKTTLGMEILSCKSPEMAEKEIWVYFLAYNLIRLVMAQSAKLADLLPRQISFKHTLQIWLAYRQVNVEYEESLSELCVLIAENTVGNRPGRIEPRAVKMRPKPYPLLMKPRVEAQESIRINGHPKKQKYGQQP
jgi:Transposase DDE domain.